MDLLFTMIVPLTIGGIALYAAGGWMSTPPWSRGRGAAWRPWSALCPPWLG